MTQPLTVRHRGGPLHGYTYETDDDQVPQHVAYTHLPDGTPIGWQGYSIVERYYVDGLLVEITREHDNELAHVPVAIRR